MYHTAAPLINGVLCEATSNFISWNAIGGSTLQVESKARPSMTPSLWHSEGRSLLLLKPVEQAWVYGIARLTVKPLHWKWQKRQWGHAYFSEEKLLWCQGSLLPLDLCLTKVTWTETQVSIESSVLINCSQFIPYISPKLSLKWFLLLIFSLHSELICKKQICMGLPIPRACRYLHSSWTQTPQRKNRCSPTCFWGLDLGQL